VYEVCVVPDESVRASVLPNAVGQEASRAAESVRWKTSSMPPFRELAVLVSADHFLHGICPVVEKGRTRSHDALCRAASERIIRKIRCVPRSIWLRRFLASTCSCASVVVMFPFKVVERLAVPQV